jgi:hypothetical protein
VKCHFTVSTYGPQCTETLKKRTGVDYLSFASVGKEDAVLLGILKGISTINAI